MGDRETPRAFHQLLKHIRTDYHILKGYGRWHISPHHQGHTHLVGDPRAAGRFCCHVSPITRHPILHSNGDTGTHQGERQEILPAIISSTPPVPPSFIGGTLTPPPRSIHASHITSSGTAVGGQDGTISHMSPIVPTPFLPRSRIITATLSDRTHHSELQTLTADYGVSSVKDDSSGGAHHNHAGAPTHTHQSP